MSAGFTALMTKLLSCPPAVEASSSTTISVLVLGGFVGGKVGGDVEGGDGGTVGGKVGGDDEGGEGAAVVVVGTNVLVRIYVE